MRQVWIYIMMLSLTLISAFQALRSKTLIRSAVWLALVSACVSVLLYLLGAQMIAVVELSVGAGLVTVLFVFAISIAGDEGLDKEPLIARPIAGGLLLLSVGLLAWFTFSPGMPQPNPDEAPLAQILWQDRGMDAFVQAVLIFSGVLGLLGVLAESEAPLKQPMAQEISAIREQELLALEGQGPQRTDQLEIASEGQVLGERV